LSTSSFFPCHRSIRFLVILSSIQCIRSMVKLRGKSMELEAWCMKAFTIAACCEGVLVTRPSALLTLTKSIERYSCYLHTICGEISAHSMINFVDSSSVECRPTSVKIVVFGPVCIVRIIRIVAWMLMVYSFWIAGDPSTSFALYAAPPGCGIRWRRYQLRRCTKIV